jgi:hypothetical protein
VFRHFIIRSRYHITCCNLNQYVSYFKFLCIYFLKFIVYKINSEMFKSGIVVLTRRENADITDIDVTMS